MLHLNVITKCDLFLHNLITDKTSWYLSQSPPTLLPRPSPSSSPRPPPPSSSPPSPPFLCPFQSIPPRPLHVHFSHVSSSCHFFLDPSCNSRRHPSGLHLFITLFLDFHILLLHPLHHLLCHRQSLAFILLLSFSVLPSLFFLLFFLLFSLSSEIASFSTSYFSSLAFLPNIFGSPTLSEK